MLSLSIDLGRRGFHCPMKETELMQIFVNMSEVQGSMGRKGREKVYMLGNLGKFLQRG